MFTVLVINKLKKIKLKRFKIPLLILTLFIALENILLTFNNIQARTTILGLKLNNQNLTGLSRPQLEEIIKKEVAENDHPLKLVYNSKNFDIKKANIGAKINPTLFTNQLLDQGRKGSFFKKILDQNKALIGSSQVKLKGDISQALLSLKILEIQSEVNEDALPLMPDFTHDFNKTLPAKDGVKVDTNKLTIAIIDNIFDPPPNPIPIPTIKTFTNHQEAELAPIRKQAKKIIEKPILIESDKITFTLSPDDLRAMLTVLERPNPKDSQKLILILRLDDKKLNQKLGQFARKVEEITNAEFDDHDARVAIYAQVYSNKRALVHIPTGRRLEQRVLGTQSGPKVVYLTFDDGPNSIYHPMVLDILKAYNIKATFFLVGQNVQRDLDMAKRTAGEGNKIGNHSLTHAFLPKLSAGEILNELQNTGDILQPLNRSDLFRPPYGGVNINVKNSAEKLGLKLTLWDVDPRDWSEPPTDELVRRIVSATKSGSDILLHSNHLATVKALPKIIETLQSQGYSFEVAP